VGTQRFLEVTPHVRGWMILITAVSAVQVWFTLVDPDYHSRLVLTTMMSATLSGIHAWLVLRKGAFSFARGMTLGVLMLLLTAQVLRLVTSFTAPFPTNAAFFDTSPLQLIYITTFSFAILLFSISAVLMATDRLRVELGHLANHDSLTNAYTRRHMDEACRVELERCHRHGRKLCLMMIDMDHFKAINDQHGHQAGDRVLIDLVGKVNGLLRRPDQLGRFGGEEFVLLLPETTMDEALAVADRIRALCAQPSPTPSCTVSIGVTTNHKDTETVDSLMARADAALYRAKANGRNRVESG
jgi:diguanylate cyclase (GGDEF)-like protein